MVRTGGSTNSTNIGNPVICIIYVDSACIFGYFAYRLVKISDKRLDGSNVMEMSDQNKLSFNFYGFSYTKSSSHNLILNALEVALMNASEYCSLPACGYYQAGESHPLRLIQSEGHTYR